MRRLLIIAVLTLAVTGRGMAQQAAVPEPILNVTIDPPRIVVGQQTTLRIDVLAPNYMTSPPELPGFQVSNAVTRQLRNVNLSEVRNGASYGGVRFEFAIYPQEPGAYAVADQTLKLKYAAEPPAVREVTLALPRVAFEAYIPGDAVGLDPFVAASRLTVEQSTQRSSEQLKVGDSVTRSIIVRAEDTPSMLLPPVTFPAVDGLAVYPAQSLLQDKTEGRADALTAVRTDSATYILQRQGDYVLPPVDVRWWNAWQGRIETAHLDAVTLQVAANPGMEAARVGAPARRSGWAAVAGFVLDHWTGVIAAIAGVIALAWIAPRLARAIAARHRRRRAAYLQSEQFAFDMLRRAARSGDARTSYFALLDWLQRFAPARTVNELTTAAHDPVLEQEVTALETQLFANERGGADWSPQKFMRHVSTARRGLGRMTGRCEAQAALPPINPRADRIQPRHQWRKPAR
jgi:hypothetical protein